jgi:hypothetical protein
MDKRYLNTKKGLTKEARCNILELFMRAILHQVLKDAQLLFAFRY